jgi:hypothetical protein
VEICQLHCSIATTSRGHPSPCLFPDPDDEKIKIFEIFARIFIMIVIIFIALLAH